MENWNTGFHTGIKCNSTCFVICTKFAINLSQLAAFMEERKFKPCLTKKLLNTFKLRCE